MSNFELHAVFSGRVQGVGFRWTVVDQAEKLQLTGTVKNLANGSVEVYAQGSKEALESFVESLKQDSAPARIDSVKCSYSSPKSHFTDFRIIH